MQIIPIDEQGLLHEAFNVCINELDRQDVLRESAAEPFQFQWMRLGRS